MVIGYFETGRLVSCSAAGETLWSKDLHELYGVDKLWWDQGSSPLI